MSDVDLKALAKLREPFPASQIGKLPKGGVTLEFLGHGFLNQRLLDVDPLWNWEAFALDDDGLPKFDADGCLWIRLTVCGVTRIGVGDAGGKTGPNAKKEAIGDALRNAGMRFGLALDLWCRGNPDAPAEKPKMSAAMKNLTAVVKKLKLDPKALGHRFQDDYGMTIYEADDSVVEAFTKIIEEEKAEPPLVVDEVAAK
jgi:hypothetical protein